MRSFFIASSILLALAACDFTSLQEVTPTPSADGIERSVTIVNDTPLAMSNIRARNATTGQWTRNFFTGGRLAKNSQRTIRVDDGSNTCMFSFHARMENGQTVSNLAVDVCGRGVWRIFAR